MALSETQFQKPLKNKGNTRINLTSLSPGIAILLVIMIFVNNELSVDNFHGNISRIYKLSRGGSSVLSSPLSALLKENFPEIQMPVI